MSLGEPSYRALQLLQWIHQHGILDFALMPNIGKKLSKQLAACACVKPPDLLLERVAEDGTHKWLLALSDTNKIEMVFIPERNRGTLCVSSQVGCTLNCSFCATGKQGFNRHLLLGEIIGQVWLAARFLAQKPQYKLTNVVMMGMGEPLLNYTAVVAAMHLMMHDHAYGLSKYRVTLSTAGVIPEMKRLREDSPVSLALSLHAAHDELRDQLVPLNKKYPLNELMEVCKNYYPGRKRQVIFEYVMLDQVNDSMADAKRLVRLLSHVPCKLNLIPFNQFPGTQYRCSSSHALTRFQNYLMEKGLNTRVRRTRGDDIAGACGQLVGEFSDRTGRHRRWLQQGMQVEAVESIT